MDVSTKLEPWSELPNKVVLVTGASSGLGREFCIDLAQAGCRIIAAARRVDRLKSLCDEINQLTLPPESSKSGGCRAVAVEFDVSADGLSIERSVKSAWEAFGTIDVLINNAGVRGTVKSPLYLSEEEWDWVLRTNLTGTWLVAKYVCLCMREAKKGGSIINISSTSGLQRGILPGSIAYASSKAAVNQMTKAMAIELGAYKIKVNAISPGIFKSEITEDLLKKDWISSVTKKIYPLGEIGTTDPALTSLVRYLIHDSSEYVSGNIFLVDSGASLVGVPLFSSL